MRLIELRKQAGLSQKQLASILNYSQNMVSQWENGTRDPSTETLKCIADYFNVSIDYLLEHEPPNENAVAPKETDMSEDVVEICRLYEKLPLHKKTLVLEMARVMSEDKV